jgi:hypothetical protein
MHQPEAMLFPRAKEERYQAVVEQVEKLAERAVLLPPALQQQLGVHAR